jgi:hypothetical protein
LLEEAIRKAEAGDFSGVTELLKLAQTPFSNLDDIQYQ